MYAKLKRWGKAILPVDVWTRYEETLRKPLALWYAGNRHACNICGTHLSSFVVIASGDRLCPACGSLDRNRRLWQLLQEHDQLRGRILHFSPARVLYRKLSSWPGIDYVSTDYENEFIAEQHYDITRIAVSDHQFDLIICYHVLEHIEQDRQAMRELYRVCRPGGQVWIQTPFRAGDIYEDDTIVDPTARLRHFGQADHVRVYSVEGLRMRLEEAGFRVDIQAFSSEEGVTHYHGFKAEEFVLFAKK